MITLRVEAVLQQPTGPFEYRLLESIQTSSSEPILPRINRVAVTIDRLTVEFGNRPPLTWPLARYPRLMHATQEEKDHWTLIGVGQGVRWPDLDEDLSAEGLVEGRPSQESPSSLERWVEAKKTGLSVVLYNLTPHGHGLETDSVH